MLHTLEIDTSGSVTIRGWCREKIEVVKHVHTFFYFFVKVVTDKHMYIVHSSQLTYRVDHHVLQAQLSMDARDVMQIV
jgi:hypothetical protein